MTDHYYIVLKVNASLGTLFIDTQYLIHKSKNDTSERETEMFKKYTEKLWNFANSVEQFPCKDIEITLSELTEEKNLTKDLTEKFQKKVDELSAVKLNRSQLETELKKEKKKFEETLKQREDNLTQTNTYLITEITNSIKKLNEIKNKSSETETIKMLEEMIQGLNVNVENLTTDAGNTVTKVIRVIEFSSWGYKI